MTYYSTKTYTHSVGLSCAFRQWRADSHCKYLHGYALSIKITFRGENLDNRSWIVDFGSLKSFKTWLEEMFDHKTLVAADDPQFKTFVHLNELGIIQMTMVRATGCEAFAKLIFDHAEQWMSDNGYSPRCRVDSVEVREHEGNSAIYSNSRERVNQ